MNNTLPNTDQAPANEPRKSQPFAVAQVASAARVERGNDLYETPACAVHALLKVEKIPRAVWESAAGGSAIVIVLRATGHFVVGTDISEGRDFFQEREMPAGTACITNPPFAKADRFAAHTLTLAPKGALLLPLGFYESVKRTPILEGGQLARVWVFRNRLPGMHRAGWSGNKSSNAVAFAWFVWCRNHNGPPTLHRLTAEGR